MESLTAVENPAAAAGASSYYYEDSGSEISSYCGFSEAVSNNSDCEDEDEDGSTPEHQCEWNDLKAMAAGTYSRPPASASSDVDELETKLTQEKITQQQLREQQSQVRLIRDCVMPDSTFLEKVLPKLSECPNTKVLGVVKMEYDYTTGPTAQKKLYYLCSKTLSKFSLDNQSFHETNTNNLLPVQAIMRSMEMLLEDVGDEEEQDEYGLVLPRGTCYLGISDRKDGSFRPLDIHFFDPWKGYWCHFGVSQ